MVRECVSRGVREIEEGGIYSGAVRESTRAQGDGEGGRGGEDPRAVDLDTYVSTRVFKTVPWNDV